jgi:hypothetical protein
MDAAWNTDERLAVQFAQGGGERRKTGTAVIAAVVRQKDKIEGKAAGVQQGMAPQQDFRQRILLLAPQFGAYDGHIARQAELPEPLPADGRGLCRALCADMGKNQKPDHVHGGLHLGGAHAQKSGAAGRQTGALSLGLRQNASRAPAALLLPHTEAEGDPQPHGRARPQRQRRAKTYLRRRLPALGSRRFRPQAAAPGEDLPVAGKGYLPVAGHTKIRGRLSAAGQASDQEGPVAPRSMDPHPAVGRLVNIITFCG